MKKTLFICLSENYELTNDLKIINSFCLLYPNNVAVVTFEKNNHLLQNCTAGTKILLPHEKIAKSVKSPLIPDSFALNLTDKFIAELNANEWDLVINLSNNNASAILNTITKGTFKIGNKISKLDKAVIHSCNWNEYINFLHPNLSTQSPNLGFCKSEMIRNIEKNFKLSNNVFPTNTSKREIIKNQIEEFKNQKGEDTISLLLPIEELSILNNDNFIKSYVSFIEDLQNHEKFLPILAIEQDNKEHETFVNYINDNTNKKLLSVRIKPEDIANMATSCDIVVGPPSTYTVIADDFNINVIEIHQTKNSILKSFISGENSFVLDLSKDNINFLFNDELCYLINILFHSDLPVSSMNFHHSIFGVIKNSSLRTSRFEPIVQNQTTQDKIFSILERSNIFRYFNLNQNKDEILHLLHEFNSSELNSFYKLNKDHLIECSRILLNTIRHLKNTKQSSESQKYFIESLDSLFQLYKTNPLTEFAINQFDIRINSRREDKPNSQNDELIVLEKELFDLKNHLMSISTLIEFFNADISNHLTNSPQNDTLKTNSI